MTVAASDVIGVVGAGTMGAGIAQVAAQAGHRVLLYDARSGAADEARNAISALLATRVQRGRIEASAARDSVARIEPASELEALAPAACVIEAVAEDLAAKRELFGELERVVAKQALLATNTSSLPLEQIGAGLRRGARLAGMHFFNPAPAMRLVEIVSCEATDPEVTAALAELARQWGKVPVAVRSAPGFLVNRVSRPFYTEPLRLLTDGYASVEVIDRCVTSAGFPMGPFRLMDLIGVDVNCAVTASIAAGLEQLGQRARFAPSELQAKMVAKGKLGRKAGAGFYRYDAEQQPSSREPQAGELRTQFAGGATEYVAAGVRLLRADRADACAPDEPCGLLDFVPDWQRSTDVAVAFGAACKPEQRAAAVDHVAQCGLALHEVASRPGLIVLRMLAALVNCAHDALAAQVASRADIDLGLTVGLNHPRGPFAWRELVGAKLAETTLRALARTEDAKLYAPCGEPAALAV